MDFRTFDPARDKEAAHRIWTETGWLEKGKEEIQDTFIALGRAHVADINNEPEGLVLTASGTLQYLHDILPVSFVTGVTTSRIARKQGIARRLTAHAVAVDAADGALVSALGMFEQGFYDRIGFGAGSYTHRLRCDPATLNIPVKARLPRRIGVDDWRAVHAARLQRQQGHGACCLTPPEFTQADMKWTDNGFGLGYDDGAGGISHFVWCGAKSPENGPYAVHWLVYRTAAQFLELMALVKALADQVHQVTIWEPSGVQLQDFLTQPFRFRGITEKSAFENGMAAYAWWQMRMCDIPGCLKRTHLPGPALRFQLELSDPITDALETGEAWQGTAGEYVVTLGPESSAHRGNDSALPVLKASVNAFTRLWLGVLPASGLALSDNLSGPANLLRRLDEAFTCLPRPDPGWSF